MLLRLLSALSSLPFLTSALPFSDSRAAPWEPPKLVVTDFYAYEKPGTSLVTFRVVDTSPEHPLDIKCSATGPSQEGLYLFRDEWVPCDGSELRGSTSELLFWLSAEDFGLQRVFRLDASDAKSRVIGYTDRKLTNWELGTNVTMSPDGLGRLYQRKETWEFPVRRIDSRK